MRFARFHWMARSVVAVCLVAAAASPASATSVPITFEEPTYSTTFTHSGLPAGTINTQDGWDSFAGLGVGNIVVTDVNPIAGNQSLSVPGGSSSQVRAQGSGLLDVLTPTSMSWLVRVDALGTNTGTTGPPAFESGISTDLGTGVTPLTIIFGQNGGLQYYNAGNVNFPGDPTYVAGTVYRVELSNISDINNSYDASIFDNGTDALVASVLGAPLQSPVGSAGVSFYVLQRRNPGAVAVVDNVIAIPEPHSLILLGLAGAGLCGLMRYRR